MMGSVTLVGIVAAVAVLFLAVSSFRSHGLDFRRGAQMAAAWALIILGLVLVLRFAGA